MRKTKHPGPFATIRGVSLAALVVCCTATVAVAQPLVAAKGKTWGDKSAGFFLAGGEGSLEIQLDGQPIATYLWQHEKIKRPFFAHVKTAGGIQVTRNFPPVSGKDATDHATMHPGLWMAFGKLGGSDFWRNAGSVVHEGFVGQPTAGKEATFSTLNRYVAPSGKVICRQRSDFRLAKSADGWLLTIDARFTSDEEFYFGVQEEMGLGIRLATAITVNQGNGTILNSHGQRNEKNTWGKFAQWWDYFGTIDDRQVGILVFSHPGNGDVWSHSRDYGYLAANPFPVDRPANRDKKTIVKSGETFQLRFGVLVHQHKSGEPFDRAGVFRQYLEKTPSTAMAIPEVAKQGQGGYVKGEFIYPLDDKPTPQCHASTIAETPAGLVAAWFGGQREGSPDVGIWVSRHEAKSWSQPVEVANGVQSPEVRFPCWNPVLFQAKDGPLLLFYKIGPNPRQWWGMRMTSADNGKSWSKPQKLGENDQLGQGNPNLLGPVKNKPIQLKDGSILCPSSTEHDGWRVHFELTKDHGKTWQVVGPIHDGKKFASIQPSLLTYGDGKMQIVCRSRQGVVSQSWSADGGKSWSDVTATKLPNPNSGIDAVTLADGRQLLVYNHTTRGGAFPAGRNMLNVATSTDGQHWTPVLTLERDRGEFSYPAVIQTADGNVHITYTFGRQSVKHVVLDVKEIESPRNQTAK